MAGPAVEHNYVYAGASVLDTAGGGYLRLATSGGQAAHPYFFEGRLRRPRRAAELLRTLAVIVRSRFYTPPAMLARILAAADPVVTSGHLLRFEGFSACCSVYARVDFGPSAVDGERIGRGTTNVDFNPPLRAALARVRDGDPLRVSVGRELLDVRTADGAHVERKVSLPVRWLNGFSEVQVVQSRMTQVLQVGGGEASRFFRGLPRSGTSRRPGWVTRSGRSLRLGQVAAPGGVRVSGVERLRPLEELAHEAKSLTVYADDRGSSSWELAFDECRFHLVVSPAVHRGFSGEGQVLEDLATADGDDVLPRVRAQLAWQDAIDPDALARRCGVRREQVVSALARLAARGLVGYDLAVGTYFHRELPFDLQLVESLHPRLIAARRLVGRGGIAITAHDGTIDATVPGSGVSHRVRLDGDGCRCTCPWFARHQGARGPCKHVLAVQLTSEAQ